ncbi:TVP38/TMEM64 family protein [Alkalicoccus daliensis]|uniref:TVP38/TMEM64 family membrane protein n=1 Tax=Alkalicoccus daliensis TaxID=745820 RepID=A0A1H0CEX8_9BACI|nr:VTT domain-containing protein [Alkalicoccus daliensis]SDN56435.1 Uncharacterized membrane protein YdjX, TVP38/TMEM64 family, SNARE-associated domain [Alkalicoccus daliensis]
MEDIQETIFNLIDQTGWLAPVIFILLHLLRPLLFLPVVLVCMAGGYFFGLVQGSIYSIAGLSLMSAVFYLIVNHFPRFRDRIARLKKKVFQDREITIGQVMVLRMLPFVHFHLLSLYLMEMTRNFREYMIFSILGIVIPAVLFTGFGHLLLELTWGMTVLLVGLLAVIFFYLGKRAERPEKRIPKKSLSS